MGSAEVVTERYDHSKIPLKRMRQQPGLMGSEDDWTGLTSSALRRKLQNRVNQRSYRNRKRKEAKLFLPESKDSQKDCVIDKTGVSVNDLWQLWHNAMRSCPIDRAYLMTVATCADGAQEKHLLSNLEQWVQARSLSSPRNDQLLVLVTFNVFRAMTINSRSIGLTIEDNLDNDEALSPFIDAVYPSSDFEMPMTLRPTALQRRVDHHPWIDILPCPRMRDNLLRAEDTYDEEKLCSDLIRYPQSGVIVWGDPWDPNCWEITEEFFDDWSWSVDGCDLLLDSTNRWREIRGEVLLSFDRYRHHDTA